MWIVSLMKQVAVAPFFLSEKKNVTENLRCSINTVNVHIKETELARYSKETSYIT